jgi:malate dehydrogenase (oxaloacetate-decarboxylating)
MSEREKFASSYLVMPGFIRAILATRPERMMPLAFYAAAREIDEALKSFSLGETGTFDRALAFRTARACADAFIASDEAHRKVNAELLALRMQQALYNGRRSLIPAAEKTWSAADISACSLDLYSRYSGSIRTRCRIPIVDKESISLVAAPASLFAAEEISAKPSSIRDLTGKTNSVAVVTDGSAILGLGNIGSTAGMPVMEGKCVLFKTFSGIDAFPLCLATQQPGEIVRLVSLIAGTYGGINLEDVAAPKCFEVERALSGHVDSCVFHDDQHGTETVVLAGLINALKLADRAKENCRVVMNGAGAAGLAVARMLLNYGFSDIIICDTHGAIYDGREEGMNEEKREMAKLTNKAGLKGGLADAMKGRDVFIGVSVGGCVTAGMVGSMNKDPIIFALANPVPEIMPAEAKKAGARIIATGRSDFSNQVNNALIFPAVFRGALDAGAAEIGEEMKVAAAEALASCIPADELTASRFIPSVLELHVHGVIASAVAAAALRAGRNTREVDAEGVLRRTNALVYEGLEHCLAPSQKSAAEEPPAPPEGAETPAPQKKRGRKKAESPDKPKPDTAD